LVTACVCVYFFVGEFYSPRQRKEREIEEKLFRVFIEP